MVIATLKANSKDYRDTTVDDDETCYYRVSACNADGCSVSNVVSVEID